MSGKDPAFPPFPPAWKSKPPANAMSWFCRRRINPAPLSDVLRRAGFPLNTRCGGRGVCDGCLVELVEGKLINSHDYVAPPVPSRDATMLVRACKCSVGASAARIRIPLRSSMRHEPQIVADYQIRVPFAHDPLYQQIRIAGAQSEDALQRAVEQACPGLPIRMADGVAMKSPHPAPFYATVEHRGDHRLVTAISPEPAAANLGVAVDIGTTTVALILVDLADGNVLARASRFNEQVHLGEDVVTRINLCLNSSAMVQQLQHAVATETVLPLLLQALEQAGRSIDAVRCLAFAGNTTMLHLLAGVDPTPMGIAPFTPAFLDHRLMTAEAIFGALPLAADVPCHLLPGAAAYVGADLSAGIVASGLLYDPGPSLLIDVGTNGEIILKIGAELVGCATAAGPAFEGARLSSGMRAVNGAISHITFADSPPDVRCEVIGDAKTHPIGICGSAYVDFLAWAHAAGVLTDTGRINPDINGTLHQRLVAIDLQPNRLSPRLRPRQTTHHHLRLRCRLPTPSQSRHRRRHPHPAQPIPPPPHRYPHRVFSRRLRHQNGPPRRHPLRPPPRFRPRPSSSRRQHRPGRSLPIPHGRRLIK